jgi:hypothetical protein
MAKTRKTAASEARKKFTALHEGLPPSKVTTRKPPRTPKYGVEMGKVEAIEYRKKRPCKPGSKKVCNRSYRHDFDKDSEPKLWHDDQGDLHVEGDKHTVTEHGIVDTHGKKKRPKTSKGKMKYANPPPYDAGEIRARPAAYPDKMDLASWTNAMLVIGGTAVVAGLGAELIASRVDVPDGLKAVVLGLGGLGGAFALADKWPRVALGLGTAGGVLGVSHAAAALRSSTQRGQLSPGWDGLLRNPQQNTLGTGAQGAPQDSLSTPGSTGGTY